METDIGGPGQSFPSTDWLAILSAADPSDPAHQAQLEQLIKDYWKPVYHYIRASRRTVEDAKDLTQQFFARLLQKQTLERLEPTRGSFRGFLKRATRNFIIDEARHAAARQPAGDLRQFRFIEALDQQLAPGIDPADAFEQSWNDEVLARGLRTLEQRLSSKAGYFEVFRRYFFEEDQRQEDVARYFGLSESQVGRRLAFCRDKLRAILIEQIQGYLADPDELDAELRQLLG